MSFDYSSACGPRRSTYNIIGYRSNGRSFIATKFNVQEGANDDKIIEAAKKALSSSSFRTLPIDSLTMQIDRYYKYVHILDRMNVNWVHLF
jgi:hypothetical protein